MDIIMKIKLLENLGVMIYGISKSVNKETK